MALVGADQVRPPRAAEDRSETSRSKDRRHALLFSPLSAPQLSCSVYGS